jgi:alpha-glucuronidase
MLADAVAPHGGIVMWRAFVYSADVDPDRVKRAYLEFVPLDGRFRENVMVQVKNGPLDFQPREPFSPLFGAMPRTPLMAELQVTQEYLGQSTHLVYLAPMWKEVLDADTFAAGPGSTVAKVLDGSLHGYQRTGIAGVANTGSDANWTGHHFGQANWYGFGRLAWNPDLTAEGIADEWIAMTWGRSPDTMSTIRSIMLGSRETYVDYTMPLACTISSAAITTRRCRRMPIPVALTGRRCTTTARTPRASASTGRPGAATRSDSTGRRCASGGTIRRRVRTRSSCGFTGSRGTTGSRPA